MMNCQAEFDLCSEKPLPVPGLDRAIHVSVTRMASYSGRACRLNIESRHLLAEAGLKPGVHYRPELGSGFVFLRRLATSEDGSLIVSTKHFTNRDGAEVVGSRIDVRRAELASVLPAEEDLLVAYCSEGVLVTRLPSRRNALRRWERLVAAAERGRLSTASLYTGIGTLDAAVHHGLESVGIRAHTLWANDNWLPAVEALLQDNRARPAAALAVGIEEVIAMQGERSLTPPDLLMLGIPCKGASKLNIRDRAAPERHPVVGHQVLNVAMILQALRHETPLILIENVVPWAETVSCHMLRAVLHEQGYATALIGATRPDGTYVGLNGADYGDFERRRRMALLAFPPELACRLDWAQMRQAKNALTVADIRLPEEEVPSAEYEKGRGLAAKAARRFINQVVEDSDTSTPPMSSACWKQRTEDPKFRDPRNTVRSRLPLPEEHARLKGQPVELIRSLVGNSLAHTALGNGTTRKVWVEFGRALGLGISACAT
jgi:DNA (cytosine-5)-methyltransferase 1